MRNQAAQDSTASKFKLNYEVFLNYDLLLFVYFDFTCFYYPRKKKKFILKINGSDLALLSVNF